MKWMNEKTYVHFQSCILCWFWLLSIHEKESSRQNCSCFKKWTSFLCKKIQFSGIFYFKNAFSTISVRLFKIIFHGVVISCKILSIKRRRKTRYRFLRQNVFQNSTIFFKNKKKNLLNFRTNNRYSYYFLNFIWFFPQFLRYLKTWLRYFNRHQTPNKQKFCFFSRFDEKYFL